MMSFSLNKVKNGPKSSKVSENIEAAYSKRLPTLSLHCPMIISPTLMEGQLQPSHVCVDRKKT